MEKLNLGTIPSFSSTQSHVKPSDHDQAAFLHTWITWADTADLDPGTRASLYDAIDNVMQREASVLDLSNSHLFANLKEIPPIPPCVRSLDVSGLTNLQGSVPDIHLVAIGTDLSHLDLSGCMHGGDLTKATLPTDSTKICLSGMKLCINGLTTALQVNMNLCGVNLSGLDLHDIKLSNQNLKNANLSGSNLKGASLVCTNLAGANLCDSDLQAADLNGFTYDNRTNFSRSNLTSASLNTNCMAPTSFNGTKICSEGASFALQRGICLAVADTSKVNKDNIDFNHVDLNPSTMLWAFNNGISSRHMAENGAKFSNDLIDTVNIPSTMDQFALQRYHMELQKWVGKSSDKIDIATHLASLAAGDLSFQITIECNSKNHVSIDAFATYKKKK